MKAIIPLNIVALRVSPIDASFKTSLFKRRVANFDNTTGRDFYIEPLEFDKTAGDSLKAGIHLHWELPDCFRKGVHKINKAGKGEIVFPHAPNRWLVVRHLSIHNKDKDNWELQPPKTWVVESDYISYEHAHYTSPDKRQGKRYSIPVPVPVPIPGSKPVRIQSYSYMGRAIELESYLDVKSDSDKYLKDFKAEKETDNKEDRSLYLTSIGFLGPTFASSYPECSSVFGFWDNFKDKKSIKEALEDNSDVKFNVSYQVIGWIEDGEDPLDEIKGQIIEEYNQYLEECKKQQAVIDRDPVTMFFEYVEFNLGWRLDKDNEQIRKICDDSGKVIELIVPEKSICNGIIQEISFDSSVETSYLLKSDIDQGLMTDNNIKLAVGNTSEDTISAFLTDGREATEDALNILQLVSLDQYDNKIDKVAELHESIHRSGFSRVNAGAFWTVQKKDDQNKNEDTASTIEPASLSLELAEKLSKLNVAQKEYDFARQALDIMRSQLFMDWFRVTDIEGDMAEFISLVLKEITVKQKNTGLLSDLFLDMNNKPIPDKSLAYKVWECYEDINRNLENYLGVKWSVITIPAPEFYTPSDLVTVMQGEYLGAALRNGKEDAIVIRTSDQLINRLYIDVNNIPFKVDAANVYPLALESNFLYKEDINALLKESALLMPILADAIVTSLKENVVPDFVRELRELQGGLNDQKYTPNDPNKEIGLFEKVRSTEYSFEKNPKLSHENVTVTFRNDKTSAIAPNAVEWDKQRYLSCSKEINCYENFVPLSIVWSVNLTPLIQQNEQIGEYTFRFYDKDIIATKFKLNDECTDYRYTHKDSIVDEKTKEVFKGSTIMSKKTTKGLTAKLEEYIKNNKDSEVAKKLLDEYKNKDILSNTISGLNDFKILKEYSQTIRVETLKSSSLRINSKINDAATTNVKDNWYSSNFHSVIPISESNAALNIFDPLRGGFLSFEKFEVVDIFGQRMILENKNKSMDLDIIPAKTIKPDTKKNRMVYLPPRFAMPSRLWFRYLNSEYSFIEMNSNISSSPICGWVMLNSVDHCLSFYNMNGLNIGSFGYEREMVKYRTTQRNRLNNPGDKLSEDLKPENGINPYIAKFMQYVDAKSGKNRRARFLYDLMESILESQKFLNSHNTAYATSQSVFAGNPLALVRSVVSIESSGGLLPLDQVNVKGERSPFLFDVEKKTKTYKERMEHGSSGVGNIKIPLHLGKLNGLNDGLVGYIIENKSSPIYDGDFYMPNISMDLKGDNGVVKPGELSESPLQLKLNAPELNLTMLVDPRAEVHAATGLLPEGKLTIPPGQYMEALDSLVMNFEMRPVLKPIGDFNIPLSTHNDSQWYWCEPGNESETLLESNSTKANQWGYSPQTIKEGWVFLKSKPQKQIKK